MIVTHSTADLAAQHHASSQTELVETLRAWVGANRPDFEATDRGTTASISAAALAALKEHPPRVGPTIDSNEAQAIQDSIDQADQDPVVQLIRLMVEMLTGHKIGGLTLKLGRSSTPPPPDPADAGDGSSTAPRAGYSIEYDRHEVRSEVEQTFVQASGTVLTADGRQIGFNLALAMHRSFRAETSTSLRAGDGIKKDPLVINFGTDSVALDSQRFRFELDASGKSQLPMLASGSGFLALDLNHNGLIDSGRELFGATSGQGFADLAAYDSNGSGWIDAADPVFGRLRIWTPDAKGGGSLSTLADQNVGALALVSAATPFEIRDAANRSLGAVRATGVFLREGGSAGSLQQVDLTV